MKVEDEIQDNYRNQVEKLLETGSEPGSFYDPDQKDVDEVWEELSNGLDIDEVWNNLSTELDKEMPVVPPRSLLKVYVSAVLIILLTIVNVRTTDQDFKNSKPEIIAQTDQNHSIGGLQGNDGYVNSGRQNLPKPDFISVSASTKDTANQGGTSISGSGSINEVQKIQDEPVESKLSVNGITVYAPNDSIANLSYDGNPPDFCETQALFFPDPLEKVGIFLNSDLNSLAKNKFHSPGSYSSLYMGQRLVLGLITSLKNTWLLNYETLEGLRYKPSTLTKIVFFPDLGISLVYSLKSHWQLQAETYLSSNTGQEYYEFFNGQYVRKRITLNYSTIILSVKRKLPMGSSSRPGVSINVLAGGYASALHYAYLERNSGVQSIGSQYRNIDIGLRLGGEYESGISERLSVAPGLFLTIGLPNIYKGSNSIVEYSNRTRIASAELHLAIYYGFE